MGDEGDDADDRTGGEASSGPFVTYVQGVRTALRNNATAYGFSIAITVAFGLVTSAQGTGSAGQILGFAGGAVAAFIAVGLAFAAARPRGSLHEDRQVETIGGGVDLVSVASAVLVALGLAQLPGTWAWPLTGAGTVVAYLIVGGLGVVGARALARRTPLGRSD